MPSPDTQRKTNTVHFLHTYKFRKGEQDPVIDAVRTCMQKTGYNESRVAKGSGVSYNTITKWMDGTTMRPQYATVTAAVRAMGYDFALTPVANKANGKAWSASAPSVIKRFRSAADVS